MADILGCIQCGSSLYRGQVGADGTLRARLFRAVHPSAPPPKQGELVIPVCPHCGALSDHPGLYWS